MALRHPIPVEIGVTDISCIIGSPGIHGTPGTSGGDTSVTCGDWSVVLGGGGFGSGTTGSGDNSGLMGAVGINCEFADVRVSGVPLVRESLGTLRCGSVGGGPRTSGPGYRGNRGGAASIFGSGGGQEFPSGMSKGLNGHGYGSGGGGARGGGIGTGWVDGGDGAPSILILEIEVAA